MNSAKPYTGCVRTRSVRSVSERRRAAAPASTVDTSSATLRAHAVISLCGAPATGRSRARRRGSSAWGPAAITRRRSLRPSPFAAIIGTTGTPSRADNASASMRRPRRAATSVMLRQITSRASTASSCPTSSRLRGRFEASTITMTMSPRRRTSFIALRTMRASGVSSVRS
jgi:hypothetical protein